MKHSDKDNKEKENGLKESMYNSNDLRHAEVYIRSNIVIKTTKKRKLVWKSKCIIVITWGRPEGIKCEILW